MKLLSRYYHPTPKKWRKIGDALLGIATFITTGGLLSFDQIKDTFGDHTLKVIIGITFFLGVLGKILTNLATSDTITKACDDATSK